MKRPRPQAESDQALGVTLIELMVVMLIVVTVSALVLKQIAPTLESRGVREGARLLNVFLNTARARAIETNRPAGVWFERMPGLPEVCVNLSYAQVPEVYCGAYPDSAVEAFIVSNSSTTNSPIFNGTTFIPPDDSTYFVNVVRPCRKSKPGDTSEFTNGWGTTNTLTQQFVRAGDMIEFNGVPNLYRLDNIVSMDANVKSNLGSAWSSAAGYWCIGINALKYNLTDSSMAGTKEFDLRGNLSKNQFMYNSNVGPYCTVGSSLYSSGVSVPFKIYRQPIKIAAGSVQLPEGAVIDLNYSGTGGQYGVPFYPRHVAGAGGISPGTGTATVPAQPRNPYAGNPLDINGAPTTSTDPKTYDNTPIILLFGPSGAVDQIYCRVWSPTTVTTVPYRYTGTTVTGLLYFLVGQRDRVPADPTMAPAANASVIQLQNNWFDPQNLWVTVNCGTGLVSTALNWSGTATLQSQIIGSSNQASTISAYIGPNAPSGYTDGLATARYWAAVGITAGGDR
jgi:type II secretory pathway pseudopilin PulG